MLVTIISGSLEDYINGDDEGNITISEPCTEHALGIADKFLTYGKTIVLELENEVE